ncbi:MAG: glycosyltransferase family 4 protein [Gallionella sp.]
MKILLVHNYYGSSAPSGENAVFEAEMTLLQSKGHQVIVYTRHSDEIRQQGVWGIIKGAFSTPWNFFAVQKLRSVLANEKPDVMHVHNSFPLFSPGIFHAARGTKTARVLTLHNFRCFCAAGIPMRDDKPCTLCLDQKSVLPALRYGCYRRNRLATLPMAMMIALHRFIGTWGKQVDAFIALTEFQRKTLVDAGLPEKKVYIKPHFYSNPPIASLWTERDDKIVFVGRLGTEKGVRFLVESWKLWTEAPMLEIIGEGPEGDFLRTEVERCGLVDKILFFGQLPFAEVQIRLASAKLLVVPSINFEGFPMAIREAFALGVPVAASNLGSMPCLVKEGETGGLFEPANSSSLATCLQQLWQDQVRLGEMAMAARNEFELNYTEDANYQRLMEIYRKAINNHDFQSKGILN